MTPDPGPPARAPLRHSTAPPRRRAPRPGLWLALLLALLLAPLAAPRPAWARYLIQPGDSLQIEVLEDPGLNRTALVLPDGTIAFPYVGTLRAAGLTPDALRDALTRVLAPNYAARPTLTVGVATLAPRTQGQPASLDIYLMGEIAKPGRLAVPPGTTILQAIAEAGGPTKFAADKRIELHRKNPQTGQDTTWTTALQSPKHGQLPTTTPLKSGDVILIPTKRLFE